MLSCASLCSFDKKDNGLHLAARQGNLNTVLYLVEEMQMDPAAEGSMGQNSFLKACDGGNTDIVKYLAEKNPELINSFDKDHDNGLNLAALQGNMDMVELCVEKLKIDPADGGLAGKKSYSRARLSSGDWIFNIGGRREREE